jgi:hypothetical protein
MQGQFFTVITPDPSTPGRMLIKLGVVKKEIGDSLVLAFQARGYTFTNIVPVDKLTNFAFFDSAEDRQTFLRELQASANAKAGASPSESGQETTQAQPSGQELPQ